MEKIIRSYDTIQDGKRSRDLLFSVGDIVYDNSSGTPVETDRNHYVHVGRDGYLSLIRGFPDTIGYLFYDGNSWISKELCMGDLCDVELSCLKPGHILVFDGCKWKNIRNCLNNIKNVKITNPQNDQVLVFDNGVWVNASVPVGASELNDLTDVTLSNPQNDQVLVFDNGSWVNSTLTIPDELNDLTDVTLTSPQNDQVLYYDQSTTQWRSADIDTIYPTLPLLFTRVTDIENSIDVANDNSLVFYGGNQFKSTGIVWDSSTGSLIRSSLDIMAALGITGKTTINDSGIDMLRLNPGTSQGGILIDGSQPVNLSCGPSSDPIFRISNSSTSTANTFFERNHSTSLVNFGDDNVRIKTGRPTGSFLYVGTTELDNNTRSMFLRGGSGDGNNELGSNSITDQLSAFSDLGSFVAINMANYNSNPGLDDVSKNAIVTSRGGSWGSDSSMHFFLSDTGGSGDNWEDNVQDYERLRISVDGVRIPNRLYVVDSSNNALMSVDSSGCTIDTDLLVRASAKIEGSNPNILELHRTSNNASRLLLTNTQAEYGILMSSTSILHHVGPSATTSTPHINVDPDYANNRAVRVSIRGQSPAGIEGNNACFRVRNDQTNSGDPQAIIHICRLNSDTSAMVFAAQTNNNTFQYVNGINNMTWGRTVSGSPTNVFFLNNGNRFRFNLSVIQTGTGDGTLHFDSNGEVLRDSSSRRYKDDIEDFDMDTNVIDEIECKQFKYKSSGKCGYGFIAEDVFEIDPRLATFASKKILMGQDEEAATDTPILHEDDECIECPGDPELVVDGVNKDLLFVIMFKEIQKLRKRTSILESAITELSGIVEGLGGSVGDLLGL